MSNGNGLLVVYGDVAARKAVRGPIEPRCRDVLQPIVSMSSLSWRFLLSPACHHRALTAAPPPLPYPILSSPRPFQLAFRVVGRSKWLNGVMPSVFLLDSQRDTIVFGVFVLVRVLFTDWLTLQKELTFPEKGVPLCP